ncbi:2Fe-2S iron-sulfur cluster-binding protein [Shewanella sp. Isolate11]|uniref:2Fe-2S iron-sulfur cluster-binding protein n=1 Tax=Shewanella sp. Isolate11 TaxID=2908530 RepID=UPI001EFD56FD|nr:2Fe-2S iron-sulfur cluster-binding protein [Shewanella sp. Isolate11]MCG9697066.1 2Fe-2S iron-sulfur cluster-binding protein [Shewanella sp. Isolate11]
MTVFYLDGQEVEFKPTETVLDALIRHGQQVNYSCKKGVCKTCLLEQVEGQIKLGSQRGLAPRLKQRNYVCACQCQATADIKFKSILPQDLFVGAVIQHKKILSDTVVSIGLKLENKLFYEQGQYLNLRRFDGLTRSYCPINAANDDIVEFHVKRKYNGQFSDWLYHHAGVGEQILVQGPLGNSYYKAEYQDQTLIVVAFGSGLGVAYGIVAHALQNNHQGEVFLYAGGRDEGELYLHTQLLKMNLIHRQFTYQACITGHKPSVMKGSRVVMADPFVQAVKAHRFDRQQQLFLCGDAMAVNHSREQAFLNGYPIERVHTLSFEYKDLRNRARR